MNVGTSMEVILMRMKFAELGKVSTPGRILRAERSRLRSLSIKRRVFLM
jgi:hypothetical protein